jgi:DNA polymerase I-like protein with 3'-5' exonuclease and polymerase domains
VHDEIICEIHKDEIELLPNLIRDVLVENTLRIPLEVDIELCEPSWAVKKDYAYTLYHEKELVHSIDWS